uniref:Uncharacterized protein n=1 Tax=Tanacetum cinerariifolium TaxID=118510 RepID=A0A6L2MXC6_TANCI|nr:hypothetical protein [Tanacetum cinerariifolium]
MMLMRVALVVKVWPEMAYSGGKVMVAMVVVGCGDDDSGGVVCDVVAAEGWPKYGQCGADGRKKRDKEGGG